MQKLRLIPFGVLFVFLVPASFIRCLGQAPQTTLGSVTISSPTAASLGKFGDIPVSYHTGVPNIGVPIYTVQTGPLKLPISLDYHASGMKVMEPAGWVGAGWALNAGGVITRTVNGQPDEAGSNSGSQQDGHFSQNGYNSYFYYGGIQDWQNFANGIKDGEPDLFFFNFGGYSGKFYFRDDRTPVLVPEQDLQIIPSYSGGRSIDYFTIVTPDGARYTFGNSPNVTSGAAPIEITNSYTQQNGASQAPPTSSWYLNRVVSGDNQFAINLVYQAENYGYYTLALFPIDAANPGVDGTTGFSLVKNLIKGVRLSQISFPNGTINFTPGAIRTDLCDNVSVLTDGANSSATSLGGIQINDGNGFCKNYQFYYSYFTGGATSLPVIITLGGTFSSDLTRLRLDSVKENSCDNSLAVPPYKFTYYTGPVPRRLSFGVDHWGYYNGADGNTSLIPAINVKGTTIPGATRDAAWPAMMAGMLTRIDYPTGGYNTFDFESNSGLVARTVQSSNVLLNQILHGEIFHQGDEYPLSVTVPCTSNGNQPVTLQIQTNCNFGGSLTVYNSDGSQYFSTSINNTPYAPGGDIVNTSTLNYGSAIVPFMPAGNYTIKATIAGNPLIGGVYLDMSQPSSFLTYDQVVLGGLRIKTITASDGVTPNDIVKNYSYNDLGGNSTAVLYSVPTYATDIRNDIIAKTGYWTVNGFESSPLIANGCPSAGDYLKSPGSIRPMASVQGSIIGYQRVTVSQPGNGRSVYTYFTANNGYPSFGSLQVNNTVSGTCDFTIPNYPPAPIPFDSKRGELYSEQHYDNSGNLLKDVYYNPTFNESPILSTPAFIAKARNFAGVTSYLGTNYSLNTVKKISMQTIENDYNPGVSGGSVTKTTTIYYGSSFHNQPTRVVSSTSTGDTLVSNSRYVADFRLASCDAISDCSTEYNGACNSCQATYTSASNNCGNSSSCITTAYLNFMQCNTNARISYVSCRNTNYMGATNAFNTCHLDAKNAADNLLKPVLTLQDAFVNAPIEASDWKNTNLRHSSFVSYSPSVNPAGFAYPNKTQLINLPAMSATFSPAVIAGNSISKDSRYQDETSYQFNAGNPQQVTGHDGISNSYIWDYSNLQPIAKVVNATTDQVAYTSFEADGNGGWTIGSASRDGSSAITGKLSYSLAGGACSRAGLASSSTYIVSYWSRTGASYSVTGSTAVKQGKTITVNSGTWTYFEHTVTGTTSVNVSGSGDIDELRLYPAAAQMTTFTYSPLVGMTSGCDVNNRISYYTYDALGRLQYIRDQDGNIVKTLQYNYGNGLRTQTAP